VPDGEEFTLDIIVAGGKFLFKDGGLRDNLRRGPKQLMAAAMVTAERSAPDVENYMKTNAPWQDQTGNARNGLSARAFQEGSTVGIVLSHSVPYGIYLEAKWSGRYAIIQPTIDHMGPVVMRRYERLLERY
jgi:hypothetical protein